MNEELKKLLDQFNTAQAQITATLAQQRTEIQAHGQSSEATGKKVDEIGNRLTEIGQEIKAVQARVETAETEIARGGRGAGGGEAPKSFGQQFVESEQYKAVAQGGSNLNSRRFEVPTLFPRAATLTTDPASGGAGVDSQRLAGIISPPERGLRLRDIMDVQSTDQNSIDYVRETGFTNAAAMQVEGSAKAESTLTYELKSAPVRTVAHWIPATKQLLSDAPQMRSNIDMRLLYGLKIQEESQILYGAGTGVNLTGITVDEDVQAYAWSTGEVGDTKLDAIRRGMTLARLAEYPVEGVVLHPTDWEEIELLKGTDGRYVWVEVSVGGVMRVWRVPVIETTAVNAGESVLGAWRMGATLWDREQAAIYTSDSHASFFIENKVAILAEERLALTIYRPEAFVVLDFDAAPVEA